MQALVLFLSAAFAEDLVVEVAVPSTLDAVGGVQEKVVVGRVVPGAVEDVPDRVVRPAGSSITCEARGGDLYVSVALDPAISPFTLPSAAVCSYGEHSVQVVPVRDDAALPWALSTTVAAPSALLTANVGSGRGGQRVYVLDTGFSYRELAGRARRPDGTAWEGVRCETRSSPVGWLLRLTVEPGADRGERSCRVGKAGGGVHTVPIAVVDPT